MSAGRGKGAVAFGERVLALLEQGRFTATYKYALLLALIDVCLEQTSASGGAPQKIETSALAEKTIELYWPHTVPFVPVAGSAEPMVLRQNISGQAGILSSIERFRAELGAGSAATIGEVRARHPSGYARLMREIEWKLAEMPLPRLQLVGDTEMTFLYEIGWARGVTRRDFRRTGFSSDVHLRPGVGDRLVELSGLLRPLIQREWARWISRHGPTGT